MTSDPRFQDRSSPGDEQPRSDIDPGPAVPAARGSGLEPNLAGALSYVLGIVTGVLFLLLDSDRPFVRFHAIQSVVFSLAWFALWIAVTIVGLVLEVIPVVGWMVGLLLTIAVGLGGFVLWLLAMYRAFQGREWELPGLGSIVRKYATSTGTPPRGGGGAGTAMLTLLAVGAAAAAVATAIGPGAAEAQGFEGTIHQRSVSVFSDGISALLGAETGGEVDVEALFAVPMDDVMALASRDEGLGQVDEYAIKIKGSRLRADMGEEGYVLLDAESGLMRMVQPAERSYLEMSSEQMAGAHAAAPEMADDGADAAEAKVRRLDRTRSVAGMETVAYEIVEGDEVTYAWVTTEHEGLSRAIRAIMEWSASVSGEEEDGVARAVMEHGGSPLLTQTYQGGFGGGHYDVTETLSVTAEPLPDDLFEVPAGYTKQSIPGMGGGR